MSQAPFLRHRIPSILPPSHDFSRGESPRPPPATFSFCDFPSPLHPAAYIPRLPPIPAAARPGPADGGSAPREADATAADVATPEHGGVAQHVGDDEEADVGAADVNLVEVGDASVAGCHGDVLKLDVHVVFGCAGGGYVSTRPGRRGWDEVGWRKERWRKERWRGEGWRREE